MLNRLLDPTRAVTRAVNIDDLRQLARRRLPRILFDYIEGGAGNEAGLRANVAAFDAYALRPRYLIDVTQRRLAATLWDRRYAAPFGIAPVGLAGLFHRAGERALMTAATRAGIPYIQSGASIASIEDLAGHPGDRPWYQIYLARDARVSMDVVARAEQAGMPVLVVTADLVVPAKRERDRRHGFDFDIRVSPSRLLDGLRHPRWTLDYLTHGGLPAFGTWARYAKPGASARAVAEYLSSESYGPQQWRDVEAIRRAWPGRLVIKGILHVDDAIRAIDAGVDGIIVSNHGGRQLERLPVALDVLPALREAAGRRLAIMVDGGVRRGCDVAIALALGADFVFLGRAPIYGLAAGGLAGVERALAILREEFDLTLGQIGVLDPRELGPESLHAVR